MRNPCRVLLGKNDLYLSCIGSLGPGERDQSTGQTTMANTPHEQSTAPGGPSARRRRRARGRRGMIAVEAALCLPIIVTMMLALWQIGRMAQMSRVVKDAAREGARLAAGGANNGSPVTVANVQTAVQNFLTASGMPSTAVSGAVITVTNLSSDSWTDPGNAQPLDQFSVTVTIPAGAPFNSLLFIGASTFGITQLQESVNWESANDMQLTVSTTLPY